MSRGLSTASKMTMTLKLRSMEVVLSDKRCGLQQLQLSLQNLVAELKTYNLTVDGERTYRGMICMGPYPGGDSLSAWTQTISTAADSFSLPAASPLLAFVSVNEDKYGSAAFSKGANNQKVMQIKVDKVGFTLLTPSESGETDRGTEKEKEKEKLMAKEFIGVVDAACAVLVKTVVNEKDFLDSMNMDCVAERVVFEGVSPSALDWLFVLQNTVDKLPNSRFSHMQSTVMRLLLRQFVFSTQPLRFDLPSVGPSASEPRGYEETISCDNSANHTVDANKSVSVSFSDFKMVKNGRSNLLESDYRVSMGQVTASTSQPQSELHNQYDLTLHRKRSYRGQYIESKSQWTARKLSVCFRMGSDLLFESMRMDGFSIDLLNTTKHFISSISRSRTNSASSSFSDPVSSHGTNNARDWRAFQSYEDCNRDTVPILPTECFSSGKTEMSRFLSMEASSITWSYPNSGQADRRKAMDVSCGDIEIWASAAAALKAMAAYSSLQLFLTRMLNTMAFVKLHGLAFDSYMLLSTHSAATVASSVSRSTSSEAMAGQLGSADGVPYSLTSVDCKRLSLYLVIAASNRKTLPQRVNWTLIDRSKLNSTSAESKLSEQHLFEQPDGFPPASESRLAEESSKHVSEISPSNKTKRQSSLNRFGFGNFRRQSSFNLGGSLILKVSDIVCRDMVDTGSTFDPQDPAVKIKIGGKQFKTERFNPY